MGSKPYEIELQLRARCVRLMREHVQEYPTVTGQSPLLPARMAS